MTYFANTPVLHVLTHSRTDPQRSLRLKTHTKSWTKWWVAAVAFEVTFPATPWSNCGLEASHCCEYIRNNDMLPSNRSFSRRTRKNESLQWPPGQVPSFVSEDYNGLITPLVSWNNASIRTTIEIVREETISLKQMAPNSDQSPTLVIANLHLVPSVVVWQLQERSTLSGQDDGEMWLRIKIIIILTHGCFCS